MKFSNQMSYDITSDEIYFVWQFFFQQKVNFKESVKEQNNLETEQKEFCNWQRDNRSQNLPNIDRKQEFIAKARQFGNVQKFMVEQKRSSLAGPIRCSCSTRIGSKDRKFSTKTNVSELNRFKKFFVLQKGQTQTWIEPGFFEPELSSYNCRALISLSL